VQTQDYNQWFVMHRRHISVRRIGI